MDKIYLIPPILWVLFEFYMGYKRRYTIAEVRDYLADADVLPEERKQVENMLNKALNPFFMIFAVVAMPIAFLLPRKKTERPKFIKDKRISFYFIKLMQGTSVTLFTIIVLELLLIMTLTVLFVIFAMMFNGSYDMVASKFKGYSEYTYNMTLRYGKTRP